ncbi:putative O-methyltransferase YrrM [Dyadobacter jejuensis]|uniref:Putative O-methyltransferase YrrM n=1 Tax=Dyadobacter jejuensis TaxID=1082580 RepID=A0A316AGP4_9BACT|nr:class I SAM-dependent methyltransferase [Dyadobacter jejuensis]PWJ56782.1 putative O-methyltransferase YrrM [Dyadobacter jejuensis]
MLKSGNEHAIHSPFLFELYTRVIAVKGDEHPDYDLIKTFRKAMLKDEETIEILDLGAGSRVDKSNKRSIKSIAKNAEKPEKFGKLFYRLIQYFQPTRVLELGTSLGITTLYLAKSTPQGQVMTFEGCPATAAIAKRNFENAQIQNIEIVLGNIDLTLPERLKTVDRIDFGYFDANHRYEPTIRYFKACLPYIHNDSVFIMDDIYWSEEMKKAWEEIKQHPQVTLTVDLFWIGLVFFRKEQPKENFYLRF